MIALWWGHSSDSTFISISVLITAHQPHSDECSAIQVQNDMVMSTFIERVWLPRRCELIREHGCLSKAKFHLFTNFSPDGVRGKFNPQSYLSFFEFSCLGTEEGHPSWTVRDTSLMMQSSCHQRDKPRSRQVGKEFFQQHLCHCQTVVRSVSRWPVLAASYILGWESHCFQKLPMGIITASGSGGWRNDDSLWESY